MSDRTMSFSRRNLLVAVGASTALAGCGEEAPDSPTQTDPETAFGYGGKPTPTPTATATAAATTAVKTVTETGTSAETDTTSSTPSPTSTHTNEPPSGNTGGVNDDTPTATPASGAAFGVQSYGEYGYGGTQ